MAKILAIDDQPEVLSVICEALKIAGHDAAAYESGREAIEHIRREPPDLVVTDIFMPDVDGLETIRRVRELRPEVPIIAISGARFTGVDYLQIAEQFGAVATLKKPFRVAELLDLTSRVLEAA